MFTNQTAICARFVSALPSLQHVRLRAATCAPEVSSASQSAPAAQGEADRGEATTITGAITALRRGAGCDSIERRYWRAMFDQTADGGGEAGRTGLWVVTPGRSSRVREARFASSPC